LLAPDPKANSDFLQKILGNKKKDHQQKQDKRMAQQNQKPKEGNKGSTENKNSGGGKGGSPNPQQEMDKLKKDQDDVKKKLDQATNPNPGEGGDKGADPKGGAAKDKPETSPDAPAPTQKGEKPMDKGDAGNSKDQGDGKGEAGQSKDGRAKSPKADDRSDQGNAKGQEQNGPEKNSANTKNDTPPPESQAKASKMTDPGAAKSEPKEGPPDPTKPPGQPRGDERKENPREPSFDRIAKEIERLQDKGPAAEAAAQDLKDIAKNADDPRKRDIAKEALEKNQFDPKTGKKVPNPHGTGSKSPGIRDDLKAAAANREFAARIGQMQLDDWKKRITPDVLKKAGLTQDDWQRSIKNTQAYDGLVRQLNAEIARKALKELNGPRNATGSDLSVLESTGTSNEAGAGRVPPPPELRDALKRFTTR
jgi:hypothetical protein